MLDKSGRPASQAASVVVVRRDAVLMVLRARPPFEGLWSFPGGRGEPGESVEAMARRELAEETGLSVGTMLRLGSFKPAPQISGLVLTVFAARAEGGAPVAGDDAVQAEFVPINRVLARPITAGAAGWVARAILALAAPPLIEPESGVLAEDFDAEHNRA